MIDKRIAGDDDDLIVELEPTDEDFAPATNREEIEEAPQRRLESSTLPDGEEDEGDGDEPSRAPAARGKGEAGDDAGGDFDDSQGEAYARAQVAEDRARALEANAVWKDAQYAANDVVTQRNNIKVGQDTLRLRLEVAEEELARAEDAEDRRAASQIRSSIEEIRALSRELAAAGAQLGDPEQILAIGKQKAQAVLDQASVAGGKKVGSGIQARHPLAERWASSNAWMRTNKRANEAVIAFSNAITREGFDPSSPGFYAELTRRMKMSYPNLQVNALQASRKAPGKSQVRSGVAAPGRSSVGGGVRKNQAGKTVYTVTAAEQRKMVNYRLDPKNPVHRKAWAKSRMESAARERAQG